MKTTLVTINIGLNNNPFTAQEIAQNFQELYTNRGAIVETFEGLGEYVQNPEPTLVIKISTDLKSFIWWKSEVRDFTAIYTQECIPVRVDSTDVDGITIRKQELIFNPEYTGERYEFDEKYFITEPTTKINQ
jgi:hypothetical protein